MTELKKLMNKATTLNFVAELETKRGWRAIESIEEIINSKLLKRDHETITHIFEREMETENIKNRLPNYLTKKVFYYTKLKEAFMACLNNIYEDITTRQRWLKRHHRIEDNDRINRVTYLLYWRYAPVSRDRRRKWRGELDMAINYLKDNSEICRKYFNIIN